MENINPQTDGNISPDKVGIMQEDSNSGTIPPPSFMEGYQKLIPNAPERFMQMVEDEHKAAMDENNALMMMRKELINAQKMKIKNINSANRLSQIFAFVSVVLFILAGVYLTAKGHDTVGGIIFGTTIVGVTGLFITGTVAKQQDNQNQ